MNPEMALEIGRTAIFLFLEISLPVLIVALVVGLIISLFQALTQIQEMTLTFVPKIIAIFVALILLFPYIGGKLSNFSEEIANIIMQSGGNNDKATADTENKDEGN